MLIRRNPSFIEGWGVVLGVPALFILSYLYLRIPGLKEIPLCGARHFLGVKCPGCGLTTSFSSIVHGNLRGGIDAHPLGPIVMLWLVYMFGRAAFSLTTGKVLPALLTQGQRDLIMYAFLIALILQWLVRLMLPLVGPA